MQFIESNKDFNAADAVVSLGVGKNMVASIAFWLKAFGMMDEQKKPTTIASSLLSANGYDPYIEYRTTLWLLHYYLVSGKRSSIYDIFFNNFRKETPHFTDVQFVKYIQRECAKENFSFNQNTVSTDVGVFLKNYCPPKKFKSIEDDCSGLLTELGVIRQVTVGDNDVYTAEYADPKTVPPLAVLYVIADGQAKGILGHSIAFDDLLNKQDSPGNIFVLNPAGMMHIINQLTVIFPQHIVYSDHAGIRELQFKQLFPTAEVLQRMYNALPSPQLF